MALKDTWKDLVDNVDDIEVKPINDIAHSVISNEENKLDKVTSNGSLRAYGVDNEGNQTMISTTTSAEGNALLLTDENGNSSVADPTEDNHIANKKFVDEENTKQNNMFANALKGKASGEMLLLTDVSPLEHDIKVKLRSKNLISYPYKETTKTVNGITFTDNGDGSITINGTNTSESMGAYYYCRLNEIISLAQGDYSISSQGNDGSCRVGVTVFNKLSGAVRYVTSSNSITATIAENECINQIYIAVDAGKTVDNITVYPQLEKGTIATKRTPYVPDDATVTLTTCGKNLIPYPYSFTSGLVRNGVTYIDNGDGGVTLNGTSTAADELNIASNIKLQNGNYTRSKSVKGAGVNMLINGKYVNWQLNGEQSITAEFGDVVDRLFIYTSPKTTYSNVTVYPLLGYGLAIGDYESYKEGETITTTLADGAVLKNIYPNMSIIPDIEGVVIDVEYCKDTNIVVNNLMERIAALEAAAIS